MLKTYQSKLVGRAGLSRKHGSKLQVLSGKFAEKRSDAVFIRRMPEQPKMIA